MTRKRTDNNQRDIVEALRAIGASVQSLASVGSGCPDLLVGYHRNNILLEVKFEKGTWTEPELKWHMNWQGEVRAVRTVDEAIAIVTGKA
jgi:Holliday junction resolvase